MMDEHCESSQHGPEVIEFLARLKLDVFCAVASTQRNGLHCQPGRHIIGGYNVIQELNFDDGATWLTRIPIPSSSFQPDECTLSYAAVLRLLKKRTKIPVPHIYYYALQSDATNSTNVAFLMMERLPGKALPTLEPIGRAHSPEELLIAKKVQEQLTDIIIELASLKFDAIGSLREDNDGGFFIGPFIDPQTTASSKEKLAAYEQIGPKKQGPYYSISEFYTAMSEFNQLNVSLDPDTEDLKDSIKDYKTLAEIALKIPVVGFENGPFVPIHSDLTVENILVDDDFNITGVVDFNGVTAPLPSLCVYPFLFFDNYAGCVVDRDAFLEVFITRESLNPSSALSSKTVRKRLMEFAMDRANLDQGMLGPFAPLVVPHLYKRVFGIPYS